MFRPDDPESSTQADPSAASSACLIWVVMPQFLPGTNEARIRAGRSKNTLANNILKTQGKIEEQKGNLEMTGCTVHIKIYEQIFHNCS